MKLYQKLAREIERYNRCLEDRPDCAQDAREAIENLMGEMPSGSGWNHGTKIDLAESTAKRIVLTGSWHHMDDMGGYDGWTQHCIVITASLAFGFELNVTGRNRDNIKDYLSDVFNDTLSMEMDGAM